tara:strand:+ start:82 stop:1110 length:1029 start_codon:yes stop_codon:yes gene_type:complete
MQKVNWGIIGLGSIANEFAKAFNNLNYAKLLAISSKDKKKINIFKNNFEIQDNYCFNNYDELIKEEKLDIIYLALPTFLHKKWTISCLQNNKNILVEKPATMNLDEILEIKKYCNNKNYFFEAFMYLFHPQIEKIIDLIKEGEIGEILSMETNFGKNILTKKNWFGFVKKKKIDPTKRIFNKKMGGGSILDLGCYPVSFSLLIASLKSTITNKNVNCIDINNKLGDTGVEVDSYATLSFDNNFVSRIGASFSRDLGRKSEIIGSKAKIIVEDTWTANPSKVILKKKNKDIVFNFNSPHSVYSYEIELLSKFILNKQINDHKVFTIDKSILNMQIIDAWRSNI